VLDCCHSGTGFDLRYACHDISAPMPSILDDRGELLLRARANYDRTQWVHGHTMRVCEREAESRADVLLISGCRDAETSADAWEGGASTGALTYALLRFVSDRRHRRPLAHERTPLTLLADMACWLRSRGYTQRPCVSFGRRAAYDAAATTAWAPFAA